MKPPCLVGSTLMDWWKQAGEQLLDGLKLWRRIGCGRNCRGLRAVSRLLTSIRAMKGRQSWTSERHGYPDQVSLHPTQEPHCKHHTVRGTTRLASQKPTKTRSYFREKALIDLLDHAKKEGYAIPAVNCWGTWCSLLLRRRVLLFGGFGVSAWLVEISGSGFLDGFGVRHLGLSA